MYAFKPGAPGDEITFWSPNPWRPRPGLPAILPVSDWRDFSRAVKPDRQYLSPDGTTFFPPERISPRRDELGRSRAARLLRGFGIAPAPSGHKAYITSEAEITTWEGTVGPDGSLNGLKVFANQGGEAVTVDSRGNVYIAEGDVYVYDPSGKLVDTIRVPERATQLVFGGPDSRTLFIAARTSLYSIVRP